MSNDVDKEERLKRIEKVGDKILEQAKEGENPELEVPVRTLSNVDYDEESRKLQLGDKKSSRHLFNLAHIRKFTQTLESASVAKQLLEVDKHLSLRETFYKTKRTIPGTSTNIVDEQSESDNAIEDLELLTGLTREQFHINANRAGSVAGKVVIEDRGDEINWSKLGSGGWSIPSNVEDIKFKSVDADFVLYIEKMATFERLHEDEVWDKQNCIVMASQGQATRGIRRLLQRLHEEHDLPIYVLTDLDPWGFYIFSVLKYGSINLAAFSDELAIPEIRFLGLTVEDVEKYGLEEHKIKFKDSDKKRLNQMADYDWFEDHDEWQEQFDQLRDMEAKVELAALSANGITFISEEYIPEKIENGDYID